jgi:hypothetical protein
VKSTLVDAKPNINIGKTLTRLGRRLMNLPKVLLLLIIKVSVVSRASYIWVARLLGLSAKNQMHGMPSSGRRIVFSRTRSVSNYLVTISRKNIHLIPGTGTDENSEPPPSSNENQEQPSGKQKLNALVRDYKPEYDALSKAQRADLLRDYDEHKSNLRHGFRISTKSRVNDITHTLKAVENEVCPSSSNMKRLTFVLAQLNNLKSRTGAETMLFTTRGSTDLPLRGVTYATEGVDNFLEGAMKIDTQDFVGKMEGFAIQGVKGLL